MNVEEFRAFYLRQLQSRLGGIASELTRLSYSSLAPREAWPPAINAYRCRNCVVICVELAGVDRSEIQVHVEPRRLWLRGQRVPPEPREAEGPPLQVLAMEIDHGAFEREIVLPVEVDPEQVRAEQREGLLWISLPLADES
jgi:HSP20 family protein